MGCEFFAFGRSSEPSASSSVSIHRYGRPMAEVPSAGLCSVQQYVFARSSEDPVLFETREKTGWVRISMLSPIRSSTSASKLVSVDIVSTSWGRLFKRYGNIAPPIFICGFLKTVIMAAASPTSSAITKMFHRYNCSSQPRIGSLIVTRLQGGEEARL